MGSGRRGEGNQAKDDDAYKIYETKGKLEQLGEASRSKCVFFYI